MSFNHVVIGLMPSSPVPIRRSSPQPSSSVGPQLAPSSSKPVRSENSTGMLFGFAAYGLWGMLPLYFILLLPANSLDIVANRVLWSVIFCAVIITVTRGWPKLVAAVRNPRILGTLSIAGVLIVINWLTYVFAVTSGNAIEASLGYFINPLVSVLLGVIILKEKLRPLQWGAVGVGFVAVGVLAISYGKLPWIALVLAFSFGLYGFVKNRVGGKVDALTSLSVETAALTPFAIITIVILMSTGQATLTTMGAGHFWLLASTGIVTAVPLLLFGASARRLPMTTIGMLQYVAPLLQFAVAIIFLGEHMGLDRWIGFGVVWLALVMLTVDQVAHYRKFSRLRRAAA